MKTLEGRLAMKDLRESVKLRELTEDEMALVSGGAVRIPTILILIAANSGLIIRNFIEQGEKIVRILRF